MPENDFFGAGAFLESIRRLSSASSICSDSSPRLGRPLTIEKWKIFILARAGHEKWIFSTIGRQLLFHYVARLFKVDTQKKNKMRKILNVANFRLTIEEMCIERNVFDVDVVVFCFLSRV